MTKLPAWFVGHGSPMVALDDDAYTRSLRAFGAAVGQPRAIVVVTAHREAAAPVRVSAARKPALVYDFFGFPRELYELTYGAPGDPALAGDVAGTLRDHGFDAVTDEARGLDHGCWIPLRHAFPAADVPVLQVSLPRPRSNDQLYQMGEALSPLRSEGILLVGSGNVVHNLGIIDEDKQAPTEPWALQFDAWFTEKLRAGDREALARHRNLGALSKLAAPTTEHYDPALVVAGAADRGEHAVATHASFQHGTISMRCFAVQNPAA